MRSSPTPVSQHNDQHPALPSYAEAMGTAPTTNFPHMYTVDQHAFYPPGPAYGPQAVPVHVQSSGQQLNYTHGPISTTGFPYPPTYTTNAYPQYGQTATDLDGPTTIHIIRQQPVESTCCGSTSGRLLGIVIGAAIFCAILRSAFNSHSHL